MTPEQAIASVVTLLTSIDKKLEAIDWKLWEFHKKLQVVKMPANSSKEKTNEVKDELVQETEVKDAEKKSRTRRTAA